MNSVDCLVGCNVCVCLFLCPLIGICVSQNANGGSANAKIDLNSTFYNISVFVLLTNTTTHLP